VVGELMLKNDYILSQPAMLGTAKVIICHKKGCLERVNLPWTLSLKGNDSLIMPASDSLKNGF